MMLKVISFYIFLSICFSQSIQISVDKNSIENLKKSLRKKYDKIFFMSALNKNEVNSFRKDVYKEIRKIHITRFPYNAFLYPDIA